MKRLEQGSGRRVDQLDTGLSQEERAGVRITTGRRLRDVDHRPNSARDQILGGNPIEILVIDHRDVRRV